ncbi:autotransporter-associated beta strand repeat-containing protein, partial [Stenotrophomonas sp. Iso1]|uniref:autotransporter-associated beta strand repeat-containing protein n=1 Tax=Stenotrophomonas sp. Iso1 TaxID=2977283 RepID=UPI0022B7729A
MNHVYRIVFNRALGLCQVVSELASVHGGRAAKAMCLAPRPSLLANACLLALGMTMAATVGAQTVIENRVLEIDNPADLTGDVTLGSNGELRGTADVTLTNSFYIEATTPTISAATGTMLTLTGFLTIGTDAGLSFGSAGNTGTVVANYSAIGSPGTPIALNVNYGTLRIVAASILYPFMTSTNIAGGAILDFNDSTRAENAISNLHGAGTLRTGSLTDTIVGIKDGTFDGVIVGAGGVEKRGNGTLTLSGFNTYNGSTTISSGTLALTAGGRLAATNAVNLTGVDAGFDISAATVDQTIGSLAGVAGSTVTLGASSLSAGGDNRSTQYAGAISGPGGLIKVGGGALTLTGSSNYGNTNVNGGTLAIQSGGSVSNTGTGTIDGAADTKATVSGLGSFWTNSGELRVAQSANGTLVVTDGGKVSSSRGLVGTNPNSIGSATVSGKDATWVNSGYLYVGLRGKGTLTVADGGVVSNSHGILGSYTNSIGSATVSGKGAIWTNSSQLAIGESGTGTLIVKDGGMVSSTVGFIGNAANSTGSVAVTGNGATWINDHLQVGVSGSGTVSVANGGTVSNSGNVMIGYREGSNGSVSVSGMGSTWNNDDQLYIGLAGTGTLTVQHGGKVSARNGSGLVEVARNAMAAGAVNIGAPMGNAAVAAGTLEASELRFGAGSGSLNFNHTDPAYIFGTQITGAGAVNQAAGTTLLTGANSYTGGTTVSGGTLVISSDDNLGAVTGTLTLDGGTLANTAGISSARAVNLGTRGGTVDVTPGVLLNLGGVISGHALTKTGGLVMLTADNTYTDTTISSGTLQVGGGGTTGTLGSGKVINNAALVFNRSDALVVDNDISGIGKFAQSGSGLITLTGTNT